jgi:2-polyprenyl-3-methyl-5-hydroxy-6-metoxy-1,4-benzoquinol methylase
MKPYRYIGEELDVFALAGNWKAYVRSVIGAYLAGDVLEVGAGIGGTTRVFCDGAQRSWTCLEPDRDLAARLRTRIDEAPLPITPQVITGTIGDLPSTPAYDAIVYIDVLEHIEDDAAELVRASALLKPGGRLVVLSPAHQSLYTPFDAAVGHFRRYNRSMYVGLTPHNATLESARYLDSAGMLLSAANRLFLRSAHPTEAQIRLWDRWFVGTSRRLDPALGWRVGKSLLGIWRQSRH